MKRKLCANTFLSMRKAVCVATLSAAFALAVAGCAPQANDGQQSADADADEPAAVQVDFAWSETSDCGMCHAKEQSSFEDETCGAFQHAGMTCAECHADSTTLSQVHEGATAEKAARAALKQTAVDPATCESCHNLEEVAAATSALTVLTDANGTVVNPHALPASADHDQLACTSCHQEHVSDANIEKKAQRACASCHHADVYECYTCHS